MWVIKEGINFVYGFDEVRSALIMTTSASEAKRFRSRQDAECWIDECGRDLESLESLRILEDAPERSKRGWFWRSDKRRDRSNPEES
jgi:hypothetical protein